MDTGLLCGARLDREGALLVPSELKERPTYGAHCRQVLQQLLPTAAVLGTALPRDGAEVAVAAGGSASTCPAKLPSGASGCVDVGSGSMLGRMRWHRWLSNPTASDVVLAEHHWDGGYQPADVACGTDRKLSSQTVQMVPLQVPPEEALHPHTSSAALAYGHRPGVGAYPKPGSAQTGLAQYQYATEEITPCVDDDAGLGSAQGAVRAPATAAAAAAAYMAAESATVGAEGAVVSSDCGLQLLGARRGAGPGGGAVRHRVPALWPLLGFNRSNHNQNPGSNLNTAVLAASPRSPPAHATDNSTPLTAEEHGAGVLRTPQQLRVRRSLEGQYAECTAPGVGLQPGQLLDERYDGGHQHMEAGALASGPAQPEPWTVQYNGPGAHPSSSGVHPDSSTAAHVPTTRARAPVSMQGSNQATLVYLEALDPLHLSFPAANPAILATLSDLPRAPSASEGPSPAPTTPITFRSSLAHAHAVHPLTVHVPSAAELPSAPIAVPNRLHGVQQQNSFVDFPAPASMPSSYRTASQAITLPYGSRADASSAQPTGSLPARVHPPRGQSWRGSNPGGSLTRSFRGAVPKGQPNLPAPVKLNPKPHTTGARLSITRLATAHNSGSALLSGALSGFIDRVTPPGRQRTSSDLVGGERPYGNRTSATIRQLMQWSLGSSSNGLAAAKGASEGGGAGVGRRGQALRSSGGGAKGQELEGVQEGSRGGGTAQDVSLTLAANAEQQGRHSYPGEWERGCGTADGCGEVSGGGGKDRTGCPSACAAAAPHRHKLFGSQRTEGLRLPSDRIWSCKGSHALHRVFPHAQIPVTTVGRCHTVSRHQAQVLPHLLPAQEPPRRTVQYPSIPS